MFLYTQNLTVHPKLSYGCHLHHLNLTTKSSTESAIRASLYFLGMFCCVVILNIRKQRLFGVLIINLLAVETGFDG